MFGAWSIKLGTKENLTFKSLSVWLNWIFCVEKEEQKTKKKNMEKFKFCKFLLKLLKLWTSDNNSTLLIIRYLFTLTCHFLNLIALFVSVTQNLNDMEVATENGFACFAFAKSIFIYFWLIIKRSQIKSSIIKLETTIALRKLVGWLVGGSCFFRFFLSR